MSHRRIRDHRSRHALLAVAVAAIMAASCSSSTALAQPAARGVEAPIETIPWSQVGPGWMLAEWTPATSHRPGEMPAPDEPTWDKVATTLYLVDPDGGRYPITTFPPGSTARLVDWSADRGHALFDVIKPGSVTGGTVISVDLRNGKQIAFSVANGSPIGYARPDGTAVLINHGRYRDDPGLLERVDLAGHPELTYPLSDEYTGGALPTPDGAQLIRGTSKGLALMGNDGTPGRELPVPGKLSTCSPVRWWSSTVVLAQCRDATRFSSASQLWRIPIDGPAPTPLTAINSGQQDDPGFGGDLGDVDAWQLPSGTFLQSTGACGTMFLSRLTADGHTTRVNVPGVSRSVHVNGVSRDKLVLIAKAGCGGGTSLLTYDPAANTFTVLLGPTVNGGSVVEAIVYPSQK